MNKNEIAVFGGGCFWCTEAIFQDLIGVVSVMPGYAGGQRPNPSYEDVCGGDTGHAEVIHIEFDPSKISYESLLTVFFATHDSTSINRQGNDIGTQYRSIILYTTPEQKKKAEEFIAKLNAPGEKQTVTEVQPLEKFYKAENYHQKYYERNKDKPYCQFVINPKLEKLRHDFSSLLRKSDSK